MAHRKRQCLYSNKLIKVQKRLQVELNALKFVENHKFYARAHFSWKTADFTENVTAMKSRIMLVPNHK